LQEQLSLAISKEQLSSAAFQEQLSSSGFEEAATEHQLAVVKGRWSASCGQGLAAS